MNATLALHPTMPSPSTNFTQGGSRDRLRALAAALAALLCALTLALAAPAPAHADAAAPTIVAQPGDASATGGASTAAEFAVAVTTPADSTLEFAFERLANGTWTQVEDAAITISETEADGQTRASATVSPADGTWQFSDAARYRFVVTNKVDAASAQATSDEAALVYLDAAQAVPSCADGLSGNGSYLVEYREAGTDAWQQVEAESCALVDLEPATSYEWRVTALGGGDEGSSPDPLAVVPFATKASGALDRVAVSPQKTETADYTEKVTLTAVANVDGVAEGGLSYQWQTYGDDRWADIPEATSATYKASAPSKYGTAHYKCVVTFSRDGEKKAVESAEATVSYIPAAPISLNATGLGTDRQLSWQTVTGVNGETFEVAWRAVGSGDAWNTAFTDDASLYPPDLKPSTVYEWRVRAIAIADETLVSVWSVTSSFVTLGTGGLSKAAVTPAVAIYDAQRDSGSDVTFTVQTDAAPGEDLTYTWEWAAPGQSSFTKVDLNDKRFIVDGATLTVKSFFAKETAASGTYYQCIVSTGEDSVESRPAVLVLKTDPPEKLAAGGTSLTSATLSWADGNSFKYKGTYTLEYRKVQSAVPSLLESVLSLDPTAADGAWTVAKEGIPLDTHENPTCSATYELTGLEPGASYEWRVQFVTEVGNVEGPWSYGPSFTTLALSALETVTVEPASTVVTDPGTVTLTATTNVDEDEDEVLTYQWQTLVGTEWVEAPDAADASTYTAAAPTAYGTARYRCVVTAQKNGDEKTAKSNEATVTLAPAAPVDMKAADVAKDAAALSWTMPQTHGDVRYEVEWRAKDGQWTTATPTESACQLTGLAPSTSYEWRVRAVATADETLASAWPDTASFVTLGTSGLSQVSVTPTQANYDRDAGGDVAFEAQTDAPGESLAYTWQASLDEGANWTDITSNDTRFQADGAKLTVREAFAKTDDAHGSLFRCVARTGEGMEEREATSEPAVLAHKLDKPAPQAPEDVSAVTAELSWTDDNTHEGTYTLEYRKAAAAKSRAVFRAFAAAPSSSLDTAADAADEDWKVVEKPIERDPSGTTTYVLGGLEPGATYEWRVKFTTDRGGIEGDYVYGTPFGTLAGSALSEAKVSPELAVRDAGVTVELAATTDVDGDTDEHLTYQWQSAPRGGNTWTDVSETAGGTGSTLAVTVSDADLGVRYRCLVSSEKNGASVKGVASNEAVIWARFDVAAPASLAARDVAQGTAALSWTCDAEVQGTFTVEYRAKGTDAWTAVAGLTSPKLALANLSPATEYEWRVTHMIVESLASDPVYGPAFTTLASVAPGPGSSQGDDNGGSSTTDDNAGKTSGLAATGDPMLPAALALAGCALAAAALATTALSHRRKS